MKKKLILALTNTISALKSGTLAYNWENASECNCGTVVQSITGHTSLELSDRISQLNKGYPDKRDHTWTAIIKRIFYPNTGLTEDELFNTLFEKGMGIEDILHLEYLSNPEIRKRVIKNTSGTQAITFEFLRNHQKIENLILYLEAWKELLLEEDSGISKNTVPVPIAFSPKEVIEKEKYKLSAN